MTTYYLSVIATSDNRIVRSTYAVDATHFDAAMRQVLRQTEWLWSHPDYSYQMLEFDVFGFLRLKLRLHVEPIVLGRNGVNV